MDIDYSELYGFELGDPVSSTGEREIAEPAAEGETGDKEQEVAELAREQEDNLDPGDDGPETGDDNTETGELEPPGQPVREFDWKFTPEQADRLRK